MRRHPAYIVWIMMLTVLLLVGMGLLIFGSTQQGPLPRPTLTVPRQVQRG